MNWINSNSILLVEKSLDFTWQKQRIISENIANVDTPGYKSKYVTFEENLRAKIDDLRRDAKKSALREGILNTPIRVMQSNEESMRMDGNNVNIEAENVELARTQLQYDFLIRQINDQFSRLRMAIEGRG